MHNIMCSSSEIQYIVGIIEAEITAEIFEILCEIKVILEIFLSFLFLFIKLLFFKNILNIEKDFMIIISIIVFHFFGCLLQ